MGAEPNDQRLPRIAERVVPGRQSKARGYRRLSTIRTIIFLIAGKLDFRTLNPHAA